MLSRLDRTFGSLVGLATGDALGTTLEFKRPGSFQPIDDMIGGGPLRLQPGEWTDDTSMAPRSDDVADDRSEHGADEESRNAVIDCTTFAVQEL